MLSDVKLQYLTWPNNQTKKGLLLRLSVEIF